MLDYGELREVIDNIEDKKDGQYINFIAKHLAT